VKGGLEEERPCVVEYKAVRICEQNLEKSKEIKWQHKERSMGIVESFDTGWAFVPAFFLWTFLKKKLKYFFFHYRNFSFGVVDFF